MKSDPTSANEAGRCCELSFMYCFRWRCSSARPAGRRRERMNYNLSYRKRATSIPAGRCRVISLWNSSIQSRPRVLLLLHQHLY